jgi:hypothetical protein
MQVSYSRSTYFNVNCPFLIVIVKEILVLFVFAIHFGIIES